MMVTEEERKFRRREYWREIYRKNRDRRLESKRKYDHSEKGKETRKKYQEAHQSKKTKYRRELAKTPEGRAVLEKRYKERKRASIKRYQARLNQWYAEYKGALRCSRCPENHPACLVFHHNNPDKKEMNISQMVNQGFSKRKILEEIKKCTIFCANCHAKFHWELNQEEKRGENRIEMIKVKVKVPASLLHI